LRWQALLSPDFHIEIGLGFQLDADIEQGAAKRVEHMRIVGHAQEGDMNDAIDGLDLAHLSGPLQYPFLDCAGKSAFNLIHIRHEHLLFKSLCYIFKSMA
jgi:hypothetical protein